MDPGSGTAAGSRRPVRLIVVDIEGCLIPGARQDWPLASLGRIAAFNRWSRRRDGVQLTVASGRPAQYVEAVGQAISLRLPAICENGAFIYDPVTGGVTPQFEALAGARIGRLARAFRERSPLPLRVAHGKEACVSLIPQETAGAEMAALAAGVLEAIDELLGPAAREAFQVTYSAGAVDVTPAGVTKGAALRALLELLDLAPAEVAAVGDGGNDLSMFAVAGRSAAPANALTEVRRQAGFVAAAEYGEGVIEIIARLTGTSAQDWEG